MALSLSNLKPARGSAKKRKIIGRGGKRGTYSGKGMKGQRARSGGRSGLKALGLKQIIRRVPKNRGFKSLKLKMSVVNISDLEAKFQNGDKVEPKTLLKAGLIDTTLGGVKILGDGELKKKLTIEAHAFSASAKKAIEAAGGEVIIKEKNKETKAKAKA